MNTYTEIFGVDISKDVFDSYGTLRGHAQFTNTDDGFYAFAKALPENSLIVLEATGYYHFRLAQFLDMKGFAVSVVNPLSVKRFLQMKLAKIKTDKSDAKAICEYAQVNEVPMFDAMSHSRSACFQLLRLMASYQKKCTATKNKLHGEQILGIPSQWVYRSLKRDLKHLEKEIKAIELQLLRLVKKEQKEQLRLLTGIPGIGPKTALFLIIATNGFSKFERASQLCSYVGITPTIRISGSSVRGKSRISKMGNKQLRNLLFLCSFSACKYNRSCRALYERIVAKGKSKKLALIAVANKLLKQAFAIVKSGKVYNENFTSTLALNHP